MEALDDADKGPILDNDEVVRYIRDAHVHYTV